MSSELKEYSLKIKEGGGFILSLSKRNSRALAVLAAVVVLAALYFISRDNYLLFHSFIEITATAIAFTIFIIAWNARNITDNDYLLFIGISFFFIGFLNLFHIFSYHGMGLFSLASTDTALKVWIAEIFLQAISFFVALFFVRRKINLPATFSAYAIAVTLILLSIFYWKIFPTTYINAIGLTPFKIIGEYVISSILFCAILFMIYRRREFSKKVLNLMIAAMALNIASELALTFYMDFYDVFNVLGHLLRIIYFYLIYKALIETGFINPHDLLFRNLKLKEENLTRYSADLANANRQLGQEIEGRKKLENDLIDSEERLRIVLDNSRDAIYRIDLKKNQFDYASPAMETISGFTTQEYCSMSEEDALGRMHPSDLPRLKKTINNITNAKLNAGSIEYRFKRKDGSYRWIGNRFSIVKDAEGKPKYRIGIIRDITEAKKAEEMLVSAKQDWETTFDSMPDLISILDNQHRIVRMNEAMAKRLKMTSGQCIGLNCFKCVHRLNGPPPTCPHILTLADGKEHVAEIHEPNLGGDFLISTTPLFDEQGKIRGSVHVARDITKRKRAEEILKISEERYRSLLGSIGDAVVATDRKGKVLYANDALLDLISKDRKDVENKKIDKVIPLYDNLGNEIIENQRPAFVSLKSGEKVSKGRAESNKLHYIQKETERIPVSTITTPVIFKNKVMGVISVYRDITKELEIDNAKNEFLSMAAHQLRTPLSTMSLATEILLKNRNNKLNDEVKKYLKNFFRDVQSMNQLVKTFLNVSRLDLGTMPVNVSATDVVKTMDETVKNLWPQIKKKHLIIKRIYAKRMPIIDTDPKIVSMAFENVLANSIKYTPEHGRITISMEKRNPDMLVAITDTGCGIPKKDQSKIFTKLYRAQNIIQSEGTGLGLYIAKYSLDKIGGEIWFKSKEDVGTTFYISLPIGKTS